MEDSWFKRDELFELTARGRQGFNAFCATLDLLGIRSMMQNRIEEAHARLNDLQVGLGDALIFFPFPDGEDWRVCFVGDSLFVVKELSPDDNWIEYWPSFCGHVFALASVMHDLETNIANPGLRLIISYGSLLQLRQPNSWHEEPLSQYTRNWLVLTGASDAFVKCDEAERLGRKGGFEGGYCWHENPQGKRGYFGTPLFTIPNEFCRQPDLYAAFYKLIVDRATSNAELPQPSN